MKAQGAAVQITAIAGAILVGVLLDRLVHATGRPSVSGDGHAATPDNESAPLAVSPANSASPNSEPTSTELHGAAPERGPASTAKLSLDVILAQRDPVRRLRDLQAFINAIPPGEYGDAFKRLRQITNSNERELASRLLIAHWTPSDPDGALQFAASNRGFEYVAEDVFQHFAASDFESALTRAKGIPGDELRYRALRGALGFKADDDPRGALELAHTLGEFRGNEPLASSIYRKWAATDPEAAALHAAQATGSTEATEGWRSPVNSVVQTWAAQDPVAAATWSLSLGDSQEQSRSVSQVMREWARQDANAAANWIHSLESGAARDAAVAGLAQALVGRDPQTGLSWVGSISDDSTRKRTLQRVSGIVMWRDPENGPAMLEAAGLPADQIRDNRRRRDR